MSTVHCPLTPEEFAWLQLSLIPNIGSRRAHHLVQLMGGARAVVEAPPADVEALSGGRLSAYRPGAAEEVLERCARAGQRILTPASPDYPELLAGIYDPPVALYVRGEAALSAPRMLAIVGSRKCTPYGQDAAVSLAEQLARAGVCVVSGMARGVDSCAHIGALRGEGVTIAVLGCGADVPYPPENASLRDQILEHGGAVISEYPPGTQPLAHHFPARNRIISGLSQGVLVVEGARTSGAMITVDFAIDQGREVFAVPGNIDSPMSAHPNRLIRDGAHIVLEVGDLLGTLSWIAPEGAALQRDPPPMDADESAVYACLASGSRLFSQLCQDTGFAVSKLNSLLTSMELRGIIRQLPGRVIAVNAV